MKLSPDNEDHVSLLKRRTVWLTVSVYLFMFFCFKLTIDINDAIWSGETCLGKKPRKQWATPHERK